MILTGVLIAGVIALWLAGAGWIAHRQAISFRQAMLYAPLKLAFRIDDTSLREMDDAAPVIYAISHQSRLDPALMLSVLPKDTLHILDEQSARSIWLEPWRELARTIAFKAQHVFVSRRLTRRLKGNGRLAVYFPFDAEPDVKSFRLYRAVARIAVKADARIVPIYIRGSSHLPGAYEPAEKTPRQLFPKLRIMALPARTLPELVKEVGDVGITTSNALFDRVAEARFFSQGRPKTIFHSVRSAALLYGPSRIAVEDISGEKLTYRRLFARARALSARLIEIGTAGDTVGLMLPNATSSVSVFLALQSAGRVVAMINHSAGPAAAASAVRIGTIRTIISSREFVERARLHEEVAAAEAAGARIVWLEDLRAGLGRSERLTALLTWRARRMPRRADDPAVLLFTSGTEGAPKGIMLSNANLVANAAQIEARLVLSRGDTILSVLPLYHALGMAAGVVLPLMKGVRCLLYPSPLHYRQIPQIAATRKPTILFATDTFLAAYGKAAQSADFESLRLVIAGGERLRESTRALWQERFGIEIMQGYGMTEAAPVVAVNSITHSRPGTVGRLLPAMRMRLLPVEGFSDGSRLSVRGPNVALGQLTEESGGQMTLPANEWHDSGDVVSVDKEGFITVVGRIGRFADVGGEMVSLAQCEQAADSFWPDAENAAFAVPDAAKGERIVLATTRQDGDLAALKRYFKKAGYPANAVPSRLIALKTIPTLGVGRIDYGRLAEIAAETTGDVSSAA